MCDPNVGGGKDNEKTLPPSKIQWVNLLSSLKYKNSSNVLISINIWDYEKFQVPSKQN